MKQKAEVFPNLDRSSIRETTLKVLIAEHMPQIARRLQNALSDEKECQLVVCDNPDLFQQTVDDVKPSLMMINFDFLQENLISSLNQIHHQDPQAHLIVYLCPPSEESKNSLILAGATECIDGSEGLDRLVQSVKKALIELSERICFSEEVQMASAEALPE